MNVFTLPFRRYRIAAQTFAAAGLLTLATLEGVQAEDARAAEWFEPGSSWKFNNGMEFKGATGGFVLADEDGKHTGKLTFDFTAGGGYVLAARSLSGEEFTEIRFKAKANTKTKIMIRVIDSGKECYQIKTNYTKPGEWETFLIDLKKPQEKFGGDANQTFDAPALFINFGATKKGASELGGELKGEIFFADVELIK
ncbi:MAG: hypothetical protein ACAI35_08575 [Candidatus Methylacidiphilales bacterium]|nr:hypothetical protein [Candidatus Methylacidiphilales bacterium]